MAEVDNNQVKTKRDMFMERMKGKYPDREFADDETVFGQINDDYDEYDNELSGYREREKQFTDMFTSDPRSASLLNRWREGEDPAVELVRLFGSDVRDAIDDPEKQEKMAEANKEYLDRLAKEKELEDIYQSNISESLESINALQSEMSLSDEDVDSAMALLITIVRDGVVGKFTPESIKMALKAIKHDEDVANADHEAEVRGKNARVTEELRKPTMGDGMPQMSSKNGSVQQQRKQKSIFDIANDAN